MTTMPALETDAIAFPVTFLKILPLKQSLKCRLADSRATTALAFHITFSRIIHLWAEFTTFHAMVTTPFVGGFPEDLYSGIGGSPFTFLEIPKLSPHSPSVTPKSTRTKNQLKKSKFKTWNQVKKQNHPKIHV
jgi:hypothetical protein